MRLKQVWAQVPVPSRMVKLVWSRLTLNRTITLYVSISFILAFSQIPLQMAVHNVNADARRVVVELLNAAAIPITELVPVITDAPRADGAASSTKSSRLEVCRAEDGGEELDDCVIVWADGGSLLADGTYGEPESDEEDDEESSSDESGGEESDSEGDSDDEDEDEAQPTPAPVPVKRSIGSRPLPRTNFELAVKRALELPNRSIEARKIQPVSMFPHRFSKRDALTAEPIFPGDNALTATKGPSGSILPTPAADDDALTNIIGLRITDPAGDGSLILDGSVEEAFRANITMSRAGSKQVVNINDVTDKISLFQATVPQACVLSFTYAASILHDAQREDISLVGFHIWLLVLHIIAILNESVVYVLVSIGGLFVAVAWSVGVLIRTTFFNRDFHRLVVNGACGGVDILPNWHKARIALEIPVLVIGSLALIVLALLSWTIIRVYSWQTYKRLGARSDVRQMYKVLISFSAAIHMGAFFIILSLSLWLTQLNEGTVVAMSRHAPLYKGVSIATIALSLIWVILGWNCVRRENVHLTHGFLALTAAFLAVFSGFYSSPMYRFTVTKWPFFAFLTSGAMVCLVATLVLGVWCRLQFGHGLKEILKATEMKDDADTTAWDFARGKGGYVQQNEDLERDAKPVDEKTLMALEGNKNITGTVKAPEIALTRSDSEHSWKSSKSHRVPTIAWAINPFVDPQTNAPGAPMPTPPQAAVLAEQSPFEDPRNVVSQQQQRSVSPSATVPSPIIFVDPSHLLASKRTSLASSESSFGNTSIGSSDFGERTPVNPFKDDEDATGRKAAYAAYANAKSESPTSMKKAAVGLPSTVRPVRNNFV